MNNTVVLDGRKIIYLKCQVRHFTYSLKFTLITLSAEAGVTNGDQARQISRYEDD